MEKDGEGQGLTTPILQLEYVNNWMEFPVKDLAEKYTESQDCDAHNGVKCDDGPFICNAQWDQASHTTKKWECGMPVIGKGKSDGMYTFISHDTAIDDCSGSSQSG